MFDRRPLYPLIIILFFLPGCVPSSMNPLSPAEKGGVDEALLGSWWWHDKESGPGFLHVGRSSDGKRMEMVMLEFTERGEIKFERYRGFSTTLDGHRYLNILDPKPPSPDSSYLIIHYTLDGQRLGLALMKEQVVEKAIADGRIQGRIEDRRFFSKAVITAPSGELRRFVTANRGRLFDKMNYLTRLSVGKP